MADLLFQSMLAGNGSFQDRVRAAVMNAAIAVMNETGNEVQTLSITGLSTGGSFTLASLPGTITNQMTGTLVNASGNVTGLSSTVGLWVGMAVTGTNVAANATIASITGLTTLTLSANSSAAGAQTLTFSGTPLASIPFNADGATVQAALQAIPAIGVGNVVCTGGPLPSTPVVINWVGSLGDRPQRLITIGTNSLTPTGTPSVARTTAGIAKALHTERMRQAARVLYGSLDIFRVALTVAGNATVQTRFDSAGLPIAAESQIADDIQFAVNGNWNAFN